MKRLSLFLLVGIVVAGVAFARWRSTPRTLMESQAQAAGLPLRLPLARPRIVVLKSRRQLQLFSAGAPVRTYRIALGFAPEGDKEREGDGKTPEGTFTICGKNPSSRFYRSLHVNYPSASHAKRGWDRGAIGEAEYRKITRALERKRVPPQRTALGGEIFIHGKGSQSDWTLGCVALDDADMKELYPAIPVGTPVEIRP